MQSVICPIAREVDVYVAIGRGRDLAAAVGFDELDRTRIEIVILVLTRNILSHAGPGELLLEPLESSGRRGIAVEARDGGPGIPDIALAMRDGYSTANTLGAGLPGVNRLMDTFEIRSTVGVGTQARAVKWLDEQMAQRRRKEQRP
jgi:anti-sigma regulatory factor (Ser/Thr protein kinase)